MGSLKESIFADKIPIKVIPRMSPVSAVNLMGFPSFMGRFFFVRLDMRDSSC